MEDGDQNDGTGGQGTQPAEPPPGGGKSNTRPYRVYEAIKLPLNVKADDLLKILQGKYGESGTIDVLVHVSDVVSDAPKKAVEAAGELKDLDGDYEAATDSAFNRYDGVKSKTTRVVHFG